MVEPTLLVLNGFRFSLTYSGELICPECPTETENIISMTEYDYTFTVGQLLRAIEQHCRNNHPGKYEFRSMSQLTEDGDTDSGKQAP